MKRFTFLLILVSLLPLSVTDTLANTPPGQPEALALFRLHYNADALQQTNAILAGPLEADWKRRLEWMKGVLLQRMDRPAEAAALFAPLAVGETPLAGLAAMRRAESLRSAGDPESALALIESLHSHPHVPSSWRTIEKARALGASNDAACDCTRAAVSIRLSAQRTATLIVGRADRPTDAFTLQMCTASATAGPSHDDDSSTD